MQSRIGPFAIEDRLPRASSTFRAVHVERRINVALKLFPAAFGTAAPLHEAFMDEAATLKMLSHPHLARCFGGGFADAHAYLAYELVAGESLSDLLQRRGRLPWEAAVQIVKQVTVALEYLHERQIFHLALHPDKLLLCGDQHVKLLDYRPTRLSGSPFLSAAERSLDAMHYWAPEQLSGKLAQPNQADMYAVGCLLFQMLTGNLPYRGTSGEQLLELLCSQPVPRVAQVVLDCPVWLDTLVQQLLEKNPVRRIPSPGALRMALDEAERHIVQGTSVLEHAQTALTQLRTPGDARQANHLLKSGRKRLMRASSKTKGPLWERPWFLTSCLAVLIASALWLLKPLSEEQLFRRAESLLQSGDDADRVRARRDYLEPLLRRFPQGTYAAQAQAYIDQMDIELAEARLRSKLKLGREVKNEGERFLAQAWKYEQFGDRVTAAHIYRSMRDLLPDDEQHRVYRLIAARELKRFQEEQVTPRSRFVAERMAAADELYQAGNIQEARSIWESIVTLYRDQPDLREHVQEAREKLLQQAPGHAPAAERGSETAPQTEEEAGVQTVPHTANLYRQMTNP